MKRINKILIILSLPGIIFAGGNTKHITNKSSSSYTYGKNTTKLDTNKHIKVTNECKEILLSGVVEIKNKNLDYDKNKVFFKYQRITYVIPDRQSKKIKNCIREQSTGINEINMKRMLLKID